MPALLDDIIIKECPDCKAEWDNNMIILDCNKDFLEVNCPCGSKFEIELDIDCGAASIETQVSCKLRKV